MQTRVVKVDSCGNVLISRCWFCCCCCCIALLYTHLYFYIFQSYGASCLISKLKEKNCENTQRQQQQQLQIAAIWSYRQVYHHRGIFWSFFFIIIISITIIIIVIRFVQKKMRSDWHFCLCHPFVLIWGRCAHALLHAFQMSHLVRLIHARARARAMTKNQMYNSTYMLIIISNEFCCQSRDHRPNV